MMMIVCFNYCYFGGVFFSVQIGLRDLKHFMEVKPIRLFDRCIDLKGMSESDSLSPSPPPLSLSLSLSSLSPPLSLPFTQLSTPPTLLSLIFSAL